MKHLWLLLLASVYSRRASASHDRMAAAAAALDITTEATAPSESDEARNNIVRRGQSKEDGIDAALGACDTATTTAAAATTTAAACTTTADASATTTTRAGTTKKGDGGKTAADELRDRVARLTDELYKAEAALTIAQQLEHKLDVLEREKYW